jgi:uncharacterized protein (DUF433 family)
VNDDTLRTWAFGYRRPGHLGGPSVHKGPVITATANRRGPSIPFIGLAEGMVLAAFQKAGLPMQRIRPAVAVLREQIGLEHALASQSLYTDGARILYDFAEHYDLDELSDLVVVTSGQRVFTDVVRDYLTRITYSESDQLASKIILPITEQPILEVDPERGFGQPRFVQGGAPLAALAGRVRAGETLGGVAEDFGVDIEELRAALQAVA